MEWLLALFALLGVMLGLGYSEYKSRQERKERFRTMTFEKRLEVHQQAYYWCQSLNEVLNASDKQKIHEIANEAREWWNKHCLFLDANSRGEMIGLTNLAHCYADEHKAGEHVWSSLVKTLKAIVAGIGVEYLPEMSELPEELREVM